ncbi:MAG: hypothetical protein U9R34_05085 [Nanoarchaeota archaeon]|nr:hypothetical protein [Nanoarchaeota archaeon]
MFEKIKKKIFKDPNSKIKELYLLVHPYSNLIEKKPDKFRDIWMDSITAAAKNKDTFAIMYFDGLPSDRDKPNEFKFYYDKPSKIELELGKHVKQSFGKNRSKFVMIRNIYPYIIWTYDENIENRLEDNNKTIITARGVYAERCVQDAVFAATETYRIPQENAKIILEESILGEKNIREEEYKLLIKIKH